MKFLEISESLDILIQEFATIIPRNLSLNLIIGKGFVATHKGRSCCQEDSRLCSPESTSQPYFTFVFPPVSAPNSPLHLSNRAHVLLLLNRPQASLTDADHAVRLRPDWGKVRNVFLSWYIIELKWHAASNERADNLRYGYNLFGRFVLIYLLLSVK